MDTTQLKAFLRIADTKSISRAAESLGIAQPSLSQQLLRLEDEVGTRLFDRTARGVTLTLAGRVFREGAQHVLHAAEQALADAHELRDKANGQVILGMPPSVAQIMGAELVKELSVVAPLVRVRIAESFSGSVRGWIESEKLDLGILTQTGPLRHLMVTRLAQEELAVIAGPTQHDGSAWPDRLPLSDFANEGWITTGRQHGVRQILATEAAKQGLQLDVVQEVDSNHVTFDLVAAGMGIAVMPMSVIQNCHCPDQITTIRISPDGLWRSLSLIRNPAHVLTHASAIVSNAIHSVAARVIEQGRWLAHLERE